MKSFKEFLNEMPKYTDHDYLGFKPVKDKRLSFLEAKWDKVKPYKSNDDVLIFVNKRRTMAYLGKSKFSEEEQSWKLQIASWVHLDGSHTSNAHRRVVGVFTEEDLRAEGYTLTLYLSLYKHGIKLESDNEQFQGAKPLWKAVSRQIQVEVYDEETKEVIYPIYDQRKIQDNEIWSKDGKHLLKTLRMI